MATVKCVVVTPEATSLEQDADFIVVPLFDGEKGIAAGHSPMIGRLGFGELRLKTGGSVDNYYVDGGFVQVEGNVVSVLTGKLVPASDLSVEVAEEQLQSAAKRKANSPELLEIRDRSVAQARAQLHLAKKNS
jgi:F-type H+-transporting ATPase subunit epsilon